MNPLAPILIVDDDPATIQVLSRILKGMGQLYFATSGAKALEIVAERPIDLVLLDILMPEMDGFATCRALVQAQPDLPVIFVTAATDPAIEIQALAAGGRDFIGKPPNAALVRARVALHLKLKAQDAERQRITEVLRDSEERFRLAFCHANTGISLVDLQGNILQVNEKMRAIFGYGQEELIGMSLEALAIPEDAGLSERFMRGVLAGTCESVTFEKRYRHRDGHLIYGLVASSLARYPDGQPRYFVFQVVDVTERRQAEEGLRLSEQRLRALADNLVDNIWTMDPAHRVTYISPSIHYLTGFSVDDYLQLSLDQQVAPASLETAAAYFAYLNDCIATGVPAEPFRGEIELYCKDGSTIWTEITAKPLLDSAGRLVELAGVTRDIRQRKYREIELNRHASTDLLTGAWNRRRFEQVAADELSLAARSGQPLSLVLFDIDHFKAINDCFGHLQGDQVLAEVSQRVSARLRANDVFARWGGEEFVVLLPNSRAAEAARLAEQLRALLADEPFAEVGTVTSSFGVAERRPGETLEVWLKRADAALYAAKSGGRDRVCTAALA